jgi:hypothetical protein
MNGSSACLSGNSHEGVLEIFIPGYRLLGKIHFTTRIGKGRPLSCISIGCVARYGGLHHLRRAQYTRPCIWGNTNESLARDTSAERRPRTDGNGILQSVCIFGMPACSLDKGIVVSCMRRNRRQTLWDVTLRADGVSNVVAQHMKAGDTVPMSGSSGVELPRLLLKLVFRRRHYGWWIASPDLVASLTFAFDAAKSDYLGMARSFTSSENAPPSITPSASDSTVYSGFECPSTTDDRFAPCTYTMVFNQPNTYPDGGCK